MEDYYVKKADVEKAIDKRIDMLVRGIGRGKGLKNSIVNLNALKKEIDEMYCVKFKMGERL